jgi:RNA polymerase sigma-70 factor (ECF subfamily)
MRNLCDLSDDELLEALGQDDVLVFEEIYNRYWQKLYEDSFKRLKDREAAQEVIQDFFTSFWINRARLKIRSSLQGYLFSSVKYSVLNYLRAENIRTSYSEILTLADNSSYNSTEEYLNYKELTKIIGSEVKQLPPKCRSVFELSRNHYKTNKEIAKLLDISEKTVENHLTKALRYLRVNIDTSILLLFFFRLIFR